jgi:chaperonin GroEL (HSP60 family)
VDRIKETLDNTEQKIGAEIFKKALSYPIRLIAKNADTNGNIVIEKVSHNVSSLEPALTSTKLTSEICRSYRTKTPCTVTMLQRINMKI